MKKFKLLGLISICSFCFLLTGCFNNEKVLVCSKTEESSGLNMEKTVETTFKNDKISSIKIIADARAVDDTIKENWSYFTEILEEQFPDSDKEGITIEENDNFDDYRYLISISFDFEKANADDLSEYGFDVNSDETYDELKKEIEEEGYTCK